MVNQWGGGEPVKIRPEILAAKAALASMILLAIIGCSSETAQNHVQERPGNVEFVERYHFATLDEFVALADSIAVVTVIDIAPEPEWEVFLDERSRLRTVTLRVDVPIKGLIAADQQLVVTDGMYVQVRDPESGEWGAESLQMVTQGVEMEVGTEAVVGLKDGDILSAGVFPVDEHDVVVETGRVEDVYRSVEGASLSRFVDQLEVGLARVGS